MYKEFEVLFKKYNIVKCDLVTKEFSKDKKYIIEDNKNTKYILRISDISFLEKREKQFEILKQLNSLNIYSSKVIDFGIINENNCYTVLSWLEGNDATKTIKCLTNEEAYSIGFEAGITLKKIHSIKIENQEESWYEKYLLKMERKINALKSCEYKIPNQEELLNFYIENVHLMKNRPQCFCHGDYHLGNMVIHNNQIGIIDFDKCGVADPYDELKPFCWNVIESEYFETGIIDGYFDNKIPKDFFKILKFYTIESMISHLPWAIIFGKEEIEIMEKINEYQMIWWNGFKSDIPSWYKQH